MTQGGGSRRNFPEAVDRMPRFARLTAWPLCTTRAVCACVSQGERVLDVEIILELVLPLLVSRAIFLSREVFPTCINGGKRLSSHPVSLERPHDESDLEYILHRTKVVHLSTRRICIMGQSQSSDC